MKAIFTIPAKFFAVFSNRLKIRRHSLSQPISLSTMLRLAVCLFVNFNAAPRYLR